MKKSAVIGTAVAVVLVGGWVYASPYLALRGLKGSIEDKNPQAMYDYIDFPVFKENLKREMLKDMKQEKDNPFAELGVAMVEGLVGMFVNPETLITMLSNDKSDKNTSGRKSEMDGFAPKLDFSEDKLKLGYTGLNSFELAMPGEDGGEWTFILHRKGLGWKIDDVRIKTGEKSSSPMAATDAANSGDDVDAGAGSAESDASAADYAQAVADSAAAAADAATTGAQPVADDQYCGNIYRNSTSADFSDAAVAKFESECPGYDLPIQWADVSLRKAMQDEEVTPSFDCAKAATRSEQLICSDSELARLDSSLAGVYSAARARSANKDALKKAQNQWRSSTRDVCTDVPCLMRAYKERIGHLQSL
ncbi:DUF2939 domain-containing protein [Thermomonas sp. LB-4]|uniref:DUF2939 domain-containing protein n=1 Tax=Thermomonas sp. LB-4 TaxID=3102790 RepID=UPI002ED96BAC